MLLGQVLFALKAASLAHSLGADCSRWTSLGSSASVGTLGWGEGLHLGRGRVVTSVSSGSRAEALSSSGRAVMSGEI